MLCCRFIKPLSAVLSCSTIACALTHGTARAQQQTPAPAAVPLQRRQTETNPIATLHVTQRMVVFTVMVHDKSGAPVHGLTPDDFEVTDNNVPQTVKFVEEHAATQPDAVFPTPPLPAGVYSNIPTAPVNDALNVILLDKQNTPIIEQSRLYTDLRKLAAELPPGARTAIFTLGTRLEIVCGFTAERERLQACLANHDAWPAVPIPTANIDEQNNAFAAISDYLGQFPGHKNLFWFSRYFPGANPRAGGIRDDIEDSFESAALADIVTGTDGNGHPHLAARDISIFPIDPEALQTPALFHASQGGTSGFDHVADTGYALRTTQMDVIAHETGGRAIYGSNDIAPRVERAIEDGSNYYTLAWTPHNPGLGKFHRVDVIVHHKPSVKAEYRPGYRALPESASANAVAHPLPVPLEHGSPDEQGLLFRVRVLPAPVQPDLSQPGTRIGQFAAELKRPVRYVLDWAVDTRRLQTSAPQNGAAPPSVAFTVVAYNADGALLNYVNDIASTLGAAPVAQGGLQHHQFIDLPAGNLYLRLNVSSTEGAVGSTEIAVTAAAPGPTTAAITPAPASELPAKP